MSSFESHIDIDYLTKAAKQVESVKERTYQIIATTDPVSILDIGCGPGLDTVNLALRITSAEEIVGIDNDAVMVDNANSLAIKAGCEKRVHHTEGSVLALPFQNEHFDAVRAERLFQVIPSSVASTETIFTEMLRVLKPGGLMVLADTDWATASVEFSDPDTERRIIDFFTKSCRPNGYAGRQIFQLMKSAGLQHVEVESIPIYTYTFDAENPLGNWMVNEARKNNSIPEHDLSLWMDELLRKSKEERFLAVENMNVVSGIKLQSNRHKF